MKKKKKKKVRTKKGVASPIQSNNHEIRVINNLKSQKQQQ